MKIEDLIPQTPSAGRKQHTCVFYKHKLTICSGCSPNTGLLARKPSLLIPHSLDCVLTYLRNMIDLAVTCAPASVYSSPYPLP